ncbi:MAG: hypothetical protein E7773_00280 [Sphingomonas sp.]|uniref:winged helix-turn-helix domain-containing protein n=1 Tax=Sphingomonas sp. TaxID=28214 RepID=UPI0011F6ECFF|nr:winged helix-turn-helix domain-containing protein [Sphingomonas sp.]THD38234.1 MAG: hypothetical protein E7773_00280 [Sphingomonas sp.]
MGEIERGKPEIGRQRRRWRFASVEFDEASWELHVDGRRVDVETKPLQILRELLLRPGEVVTKDELLDAVWPDVTVVEASLATAMVKLRRALGAGPAEDGPIETVPRLGYRLIAPVEVDVRGMPEIARFGNGRATGRRRAVAAGVLALAVVGAWLAFAELSPRSVAAPALTALPPPAAAEEKIALRSLDLRAVENLLQRGWDPNTPFDTERNGAMNTLLNICEWDPGHDRRKMLIIARTLLEAGARLDTRNKWGDTAYSIAKAKRYCGPDHPVTVMIRAMCRNGYKPLGDKCLASYDPRW